MFSYGEGVVSAFCGSLYSTTDASSQPSKRCPLTVAKIRSHSTPLTLRFSGETSTSVPLSSVRIYFPLGVWRRFAPPLSPALILPKTGCGVDVKVAVALGVAVEVTVGVLLGAASVVGTPLTVACAARVTLGVGINLAVEVAVAVALIVAVAVAIIVAVALAGMVVVGAEVNVLEGGGVFVGEDVSVGGNVGDSVGTNVGGSVGGIAGIEVGVAVGAGYKIPDATCGNISSVSITINATITLPLAMAPAFVGLRRSTKRVINPSRLAREK